LELIDQVHTAHATKLSGNMRVHWRFFVRFAYLDVRPAVSLTKLYSSPYSLPT